MIPTVPMTDDIFHSLLQRISNERQTMRRDLRQIAIQKAHLERLVEIQRAELNQIESLLKGNFQGSTVQRVQHELMTLRNSPERLQAANDSVSQLIKRITP